MTDMLNDFIEENHPLEVPMAGKIVPNIKKQILRARKLQIPVIYCCDAHGKHDPEFNIWPKHAIKGTEGARVVKKLKPCKGDYMVTKSHYSCFYKTTLDALLKRLGKTHLIVTGVVTNICILYTVADAYARGYKITIPADCVAALTKREQQFALQQMKHIFHARII